MVSKREDGSALEGDRKSCNGGSGIDDDSDKDHNQ
jgi:hypothetical protein